MRAPGFWQHDGALALALQPLAWLYDGAGRLRRDLANPHRCAVPVVCIGNVTAGGSGKTPLALVIIALLQQRGARVSALTRGYGGRLAGPVQVDPARHGAADVGDEALLLAERAPTFVAHDRPAGAEAAVAAGAEIIVMDDGFQNPSLHKDLCLIAVDGATGLGNGRVHPAGPLREAPERAWQRADAIVVTGPSSAQVLRQLPPGLPRVEARMLPDLDAQMLSGRAVVAFAGIGRPDKFFDTVRDLGADLRAVQAFPDHHPYAEEEIMAVLDEATRQGAIAVTTTKDAVRLPPAARAMVTVVGATLAFAAPDLVEGWLDRVRPRAGSARAAQP